jgi:hypothetical protein
MDAINNNIPINRPCICGSTTHLTKRSKQCPFYIDTVKNQASDEIENHNEIENDNSKNTKDNTK